MVLKRRRLLILLLVTSQLACMSCGVLWATAWLRDAFENFVSRNAAAESESIASTLARRAADRSAKTIAPGGEEWERLQRLCERTKTPHGGFVSLIDRNTGALICHSRLRTNPSLLGKFPGRSHLISGTQVRPLIAVARAAEEKPGSFVSGEVEVDGLLYRATCLSLPKLEAVVAVHMSQASLDESVDELVLPVVQAGFVITATVVGVTALLTVLLVGMFDSTIQEVSSSVEREVERRTTAITRSRNATVLGLAKLAESRDKDAGEHLERLRTYVTILATELAKNNSEIDHHYVANLAAASALHDVGKMGVPDAVILKLGSLTPAERRAMQMHTVIGGECLSSASHLVGEHDQFLELGRQIAVAHHEQWDGSGYPHGLQGRTIPLAARIVALADVYDALTTQRVYRPAVSHGEACEWIVSNYGSQFDPEVVEAFVARDKDFAKVSLAASHRRQAAEQAPHGGAPAERSGEVAPRPEAPQPA